MLILGQKILLFRTHHLENSTTELILMLIREKTAYLWPPKYLPRLVNMIIERPLIVDSTTPQTPLSYIILLVIQEAVLQLNKNQL